MPDLISSLREKIIQSYQNLPYDQQTRSANFEDLADTFAQHFQILLSGDFDAWIQWVETYGGMPMASGVKTTFNDDGSPSEEFETRWRRFNMTMNMSPLSIKDAWLRAWRANGVSWEHRQGPFARADIHGNYADYSSGRLITREERSRMSLGYIRNFKNENRHFPDVYEVIVPILFRQDHFRDILSDTYKTFEPIEVYVGFLYAWDTQENRWRPYEGIVYKSINVGQDSTSSSVVVLVF